MVAPSALTKEVPGDTQQAGINSPPSSSPLYPDLTTELNFTPGNENSETIDLCSAQEQQSHQKANKFSLNSIIMNPAVLSIIAHFPNKCILKKSEKYVINGGSGGQDTTLPPFPTEKASNDPKKTTSTNNNNVITVPTTKSSAKKNAGSSSSKTKRYAGLLLAILSSMMFSFTGLIVKVIPHHHPLTQATWMFIGTVVVAIPLNLLKYVYTYHSEKRDEEKAKDNKKIEGAFKSISPDTNIETVKVIENHQDEKQGGGVGLTAGGITTVISEKLQKANLAAVAAAETTVVVDLSTSPTSDVKSGLKRQKEERKRKLKLFLLLLIRACSGCSGMILYFYSLKYLNVGDSLVIVCSSPIFVFIIGYLFLGESCGVVPVLTIILSMAGVSVITRPPMLTGKESFETEDMIGAGLAFSSMLCIAMTIILMRFLQNVYHGLINLVFGVWGTFQTTLLAVAVGVLDYPHTLYDAILMSATGVLFFLGQTFLAVALQFEEAGPVSLVRTSEVVFAFIWQFIFLSVSPDVFSISGAGLILAGIFLTISRKWIAALPEDNRSRKMFSFILR